MFEEILKKKGLEYHRKANGLFHQGPAGNHDLAKVASLDSIEGEAQLHKTQDILGDNELDYYEHLMRNPAVVEQWDQSELEDLYQKVRTTLKSIMKVLLLRNEFYHIDSLYKVTNKSKLDFGENLLKLIMRVKKMKDAKS